MVVLQQDQQLVDLVVLVVVAAASLLVDHILEDQELQIKDSLVGQEDHPQFLVLEVEEEQEEQVMQEQHRQQKVVVQEELVFVHQLPDQIFR